MHGSISKSGKVRKQTPKVEKKIKIVKNLVGRAKKRSLYNRKTQVLSLFESFDKTMEFHANRQF